MDQKIYSGYGSYRKLQSILKEYQLNRIFLVTGKTSYESSGAAERLGNVLAEVDHIRFCDFEVNPKIEDIKDGLELFKNEKCDFVVGVGGGSVLDIAKAIALLASQQAQPEEIIKGVSKITARQIPTVMIPTTSGTGSESTQFSVVYIGKSKYSLQHESLVPDFAILDPTFAKNLPAYIAAYTGMDAMCQGIESLWSVNSTKASRTKSCEAIKMAVSNLPAAVNNSNEDSRENMLLASNLAGRAINVAQTTAAHAASYPLTSYFGIPHGHAVALTLPYFVEFNNDVSQQNVQDVRGVEFMCQRLDELVKVLGTRNPSEAKQKILALMREIHLETRLSKMGIVEDDIEVIVKNGFNPQRTKNNPRRVSERDLRILLREVL